jgi:peptidoglycan hydrolase-like protein with peptidoglycan-binding domain
MDLFRADCFLSLAEVRDGIADTSFVRESPPMLKSIRLMSARRTALKGLCVLTVMGVAVTLMPVSAQAAPASPVLEAPLLPQSIIGLRQGSTGSDVKAVQNALISAGIAVPGGADGVYGTATKAAVSSFQSKRGLPQTGTVDVATAEALGLAPSTPAASSGSSTVLSVGATGAAVKELQNALMAAGVFVPGGADGSFGQATKTAVSSFQRWNGLTVTGTVTPATAKALGLTGGNAGTVPDTGAVANAGATRGEASNPYVGLKIGAQGTHVKALQSALIKSGVTVFGGADGSFGSATKTALTKYQNSHGLKASGTVDADTAAKLGLGAAAATPSAPSSNVYAGLKVGSQGDKVKELQRALLQTGLTLRGGADGVFGNATRTTLILFQKVNGIGQTGVLTEKGAGILGLGTSSAPQGVTSQAGYPIFGESGDRVREMQQALLNAGIAVPGGADGQFGASTAGAIIEFQRREGLPVTGKIDDATATKLGSVKAPAPSAPSAAGVTLDVFPVQGRCSFIDTWHAPRGGGRLHVGVDIISAQDKLLYAVVDGTISKQYFDYPGALAGNGLRVAQADGTYFTYLHLSGFADGIGVGTKVKAGDVIGYVGTTGNSATPHLHFEVHPKGGSPVNPYPLVNAVDACNITAPRS